ncbi:MAG: glycoside hydrolase, partial [Anaerolineae bacterium]
QGELIHQPWPLEQAMQPLGDLLTSDTDLLGIQTPLWLCSSGAGILAHGAPAFGFNQPPPGTRRYDWDISALQGDFDQRPPFDPGGKGDGRFTIQAPDLALDILLAPDLPTLTRQALSRLGVPAALPPEYLFRDPVWTTWARYKMFISQQTVLDFAQEIVRHGFPRSVMEIDDVWQHRYGDLFFSPSRFPDPKSMVDTLHDMGFRVTVWVMPFLQDDSQAFAEAVQAGYLVHTDDGAPLPIRWWQGDGYLLDVTNPQALDWFARRLRALQEETGIDGFKFDAGEAVYLPVEGRTHQPLSHRNEYTRRYVEFVAQFAAQASPPMPVEVRAAWNNQRLPLFVRLWDKSTVWGQDNGLQSVIPGLLHLGLTGYPFVLPDMIGGNAYRHEPDAELLIRWTQLNALLPAMQFSLAPWEHGETCTRLCLEAAELHARMTPRLLQIAEESLQRGEPFLRPVWWLAPQDERALTCFDQFLVGDSLLVAPVVEKGARSRDIFLPPGRWRACPDGDIFPGGQVLRAYPAPLDTLPLFERLP